ncbi:MAG: class C beta-lactamase-related serine hydrolase [Bacteroidetes bacterium]|nr:MAG: class C beta-lactamase-related serine hydrolase [Bacteroidota bacterium]
MLFRIIKYIFYFLISILLVFNLYIVFSGKYFIYKALKYNFVGIDNYKLFENRLIKASDSVQKWNLSAKYNQINVSDSIEKTNQLYKSTAFVIIKNDSVLMEKYWDGFTDTTHSNSFSMAKSVVSMLIGVAIKEGKIKSVEEPVLNYLTEFATGEKSKIKIKDLLMMSSGLDWDESKSYKNPVDVFFSDIMEAYYGNDLYKLAMKTNVISQSGVCFDYKSGDTQLLSFVLQKATGKSVSQYFEEKIWQPIGANQNAYWCLDKENGNEKAFCCINSNALDFARLGKLLLQKGKWKNTQLIDSVYVEDALSSKKLVDTEGNTVDYYGYQIWLLPQFKDENVFYLRGTLGQIVVVIPSKNTIIVRLGHLEGYKVDDHYGLAILYADWALKTF